MSYNGLELASDTVYGFNNEENLVSVYDYEHNFVKYPQYSYLVPFSPDGGGNFYCFDTRYNDANSCPVVFWLSNYPYTEEDSPEVVYDSFTSWAQEVLIEWTLEIIDYDGNLVDRR